MVVHMSGIYPWVVVVVVVVVVVIVVAVVAATSGGITLMFIPICTGTCFNSEAVLYIRKFNSYLTENNLSLLQKPFS
jgi:ABC-type transport system involved in cytochrome bd biosynthesis fused ATPase/permease subunit